MLSAQEQPMTCVTWAGITRISIHQGHGIGQPVAPEPDWTGTVAQYLAANPDTTWREVQDMRADLDGTGRHRIGGGARGCFTIVLAPLLSVGCAS